MPFVHVSFTDSLSSHFYIAVELKNSKALFSILFLFHESDHNQNLLCVLLLFFNWEQAVCDATCPHCHVCPGLWLHRKGLGRLRQQRRLPWAVWCPQLPQLPQRPPKKAVGGHCGSASRAQEPGWTGVEEIADWEEGERGEERGKTGQADSWEKEERRRRELCERRWEREMRGGTRKLQPRITASWQFWRGWLQN